MKKTLNMTPKKKPTIVLTKKTPGQKSKGMNFPRYADSSKDRQYNALKKRTKIA